MIGIQDYFIHRIACDNLPDGNYRSLIEGQNYLSSGWVGQILHTLPDDEHITLKGPVRYSQDIKHYHQVEVTVQKVDGRVVKVSCDCMANQGMSCSHSAGMLYKIKDATTQGFTGTACTDEACAWNKSTCDNVVPDIVENIREPDQRRHKPEKVKTTAFATDADVIRHLTSPEMAGLANIPGTLLNHVLTAKPQQKAANETPLPAHHDQCSQQTCALCNAVFDKYVKCRNEEREKIASETKGQNNQFWLDQRKLRITSSEASEVPKKINPQNWVERKLNGSFTGNAATRYGQTSEPLARQWFEESTGDNRSYCTRGRKLAWCHAALMAS